MEKIKYYLSDHPIIDNYGNCYGNKPPDITEIKDQINELIDKINEIIEVINERGD